MSHISYVGITLILLGVCAGLLSKKTGPRFPIVDVLLIVIGALLIVIDRMYS